MKNVCLACGAEILTPGGWIHSCSAERFVGGVFTGAVGPVDIFKGGLFGTAVAGGGLKATDSNWVVGVDKPKRHKCTCDFRGANVWRGCTCGGE